MTPPGVSLPPTAGAFGRLLRLTRKELRETLRDRRTIVTLVLMPILLYPLLSIGFRQLLATQMPGTESTRYLLAVENPAEGKWLATLLEFTPPPAAEQRRPAGDGLLGSSTDGSDNATLELGISEAPELDLKAYVIDLYVRFPHPPRMLERGQPLQQELELVFMDDSVHGRRAAELLEKRLAGASQRFLAAQLRTAGVQQPDDILTVRRAERRGAGDSRGALVTLAPLILVLMTITGAVYPAIDLTAGERERGTLELLVAAPVPRLGLLLAKYFSVLSVALLTAAVNLAAMAVTIVVGGLGPTLFGTQGITLAMVAQIFGLLVLFATFFSAVLLTLTSFARSFKEAQAYLIPLMMLAIAPGVMTFLPHLRLEGALCITPLVNVVLLARDVLGNEADPLAATAVILSTVWYAAAALSLAARFLAAEAVLFPTESGWGDLFLRPAAPRSAANPAHAMLCLALIFAAFFVAMNLLARVDALDAKVPIAGIVTLLVFVGLPATTGTLRRVQLPLAFRVTLPRGWGHLLGTLPAGVLLGFSLWVAAHELVLLQDQWGLVRISELLREQALRTAAALREVPLPIVLFGLALAPALGEELFFRGYLFSALEERAGRWPTIASTALLFGLFHLVSPGGLLLARLLPSTFLGIVLGWVAWRTRTVWPSIIIHACHNGLLLTITWLQPSLDARGWDVDEESHLPWPWLVAGGAAAVKGLLWVAWLNSSHARTEDAAD